MKKERLLIYLIVLLFITTGCTLEKNEQKITIQKRIGDENVFEDYKEVTQNEKVQKALEIVKNVNWDNAKVEMSRFADFQFQFPFKNSSEEKIASYLLWVNPNGENLEIVRDSGRYVKLTKQDSETLYEILIGDSLDK